MEIIKDDRKKQLHIILEHLYKASEDENIDDFNKLSEPFNKMMVEIFGRSPWKHGTEGFEWDEARNGVMVIFTAKDVYKDREKFEIEKKAQLVKALKRIEKLKNYLI